ncbi:MAG TPA: NAD-dependent epimerase/dehydratase family protein, partial [Candidatus Dadabacteria bacterium]|nr:NAD-dependent epimerase/dehydratase family protein [Candidatus Dadabacteria bacterium]
LGDTLHKCGYEVSGISKSDIKIKNINVYKADVCDKDIVGEICEDKDIIIHLAATTEHKNISKFPMESLWTSLSGTYNLLYAFQKSNAKNFIFPSSGKVYGKPSYLPFDEQHPLNPTTPLGRIKKLCEDMVLHFSTISDKSFSILRIFNVYGPNQKPEFLIPTILSQIKNNKVILGDIKSKRDYLYIKDLITAFLTIVKNKEKGVQIYNVGSGVSTSAEDIVRAIEKISKKKLSIEVDKSKLRKNEMPDEKADISKLKILGWNPKYNVHSGLKDMFTNWE